MSAELGLFARVTSDFDLQSCYPTSSSTIWDVDYQHPDGVILKTVNNADLTLSDFKSPLTPFLGFVSFEFPSTVAFPSLPVPVEGSMVYPLTSGGARGVWATGPEVWFALTLGANVTCQIGHFGRVLTDEHGEPSRLLRGAYKQLLDGRARAKSEFGAKSFEQNVLGGSSVTRADLAAYSMTTKISEELKMTASAPADLAEAVRKRGHVRIDTDRLTEHAVKVLDDRLAKAVEVPVQRVEKTVEGLEERVVRLGTEKLAEVTDRAREVVSTVGRAERQVERLSARVTWVTVGRTCLALVPFTVAFIMLTGMVGGITQMLGLGPLLGWAGDSFAVASA